MFNQFALKLWRGLRAGGLVAVLLLAGCNLPAGLNAQAGPVVHKGPVPQFSHVIVIFMENHEYDRIIGNTSQMPVFNQLAGQYTLLTQYYAVRHPSLPNYLAFLGGDTFGVDSDCQKCYQNQPSLPDLLEAAHLTWTTYQEDMPSPCFNHDNGKYDKNHNPFVYFDPIRLNTARCEQNVVSLAQLDQDLSAGKLANFVFIAPNICNDAHSCDLNISDQWLADTVAKLTKSALYDQHSLIVVTYDEGTSNESCCGLGDTAGGHIATVLISPLVKTGFQDSTPYSHYSLLKTILSAWDLPMLGHAADPSTSLIVAPWKDELP